MHSQYSVKTLDMHTAGEPLRIIESIQPLVEIKGNDILEKIEYMKSNLDWIRTLIIDEPRGHRDMYGALILDNGTSNEYDFGVIFLDNSGYSTMCGHGVIALARYAVDKKIIIDNKNIKIMCPCGIIECSVTETNTNVSTTFVSIPSFLLYHQLKINDPYLGTIAVDISFGGAFYAIVHENDFGLKIDESNLYTMVSLANKLKETINKTIKIKHPYDSRLEFLYGIIIVEDVIENDIYKNIVVFANKEVDRSPCGSGVTARMAALYFGNNKNHTYLKSFNFQNSLLKNKSHFKAQIKEEITIGTNENIIDAVRVEITGCAYYTGRHEFIYESNDPLKYGFQMYL